MFYNLKNVNRNLPVSLARASSYGPCIYQIEPPTERFVKLEERLYFRLINNICGECAFKTNEEVRMYALKETAGAMLKECKEFLFSVVDEKVAEGFAHHALNNNSYQKDDRRDAVCRKYILNEIKLEEFLESIWLSQTTTGVLKSYLTISRKDIPLVSNALIEQLVKENTKAKNLCSGYTNSGYHCKENIVDIQNNFPCNTNYIKWVYSYENNKIYAYDLTYNRVLALPNIYGDGNICWGRNNVGHLNDVYIFWESFFNFDLALSIDSSESSANLLESFGLDPDDYRDNEDDDIYIGDICLKVEDLIKVLGTGGINPYSKRAPTFEVYSTVESCQKVLRFNVHSSVPISNDLNSRNSIGGKVYIFLMNEIEEDVWEAILPSVHGPEFERYLQINLKELEAL